MEVAQLVSRIHAASVECLSETSRLPDNAVYTFDAAASEPDSPALCKAKVYKTSTRTVVSSQLGMFRAREVVRECEIDGAVQIKRSQQLDAIVPKGSRYAYDLICEVGTSFFLHHRSLTDIAEESCPNIPFSSLWDLLHKFLFYFGAMHRMKAPLLRKYFAQRPWTAWLIDGTLEAGSPVFFGARDATDGIMLDCRKIPSENTNDIASFLRMLKATFGLPNEVLHDLSAKIIDACGLALGAVPHRICHYHFLAVMGKALYDKAQSRLTARLRALRLKTLLREQRKKLTGMLRDRLLAKTAELLLRDLLRGQLCEVCWTDSLAREVLLGLHFWLLDYAADGERRGYPFDPYGLLFHRRAQQTHQTVRRLIDCPACLDRLPVVFSSFTAKLDNYLRDPVVKEAAALYELGESVFRQVRNALRFEPDSLNPMRAAYELSADEVVEADKAIEDLLHDMNLRMADLSDIDERAAYQTATDLLVKYQSDLAPVHGAPGRIVRTTSELEAGWSAGKRALRRAHGRSKLTREFISLPPEVMLVGNLQNHIYIDLVLGNLDNLPAKLAEAGRTAGPFTKRNRHGQDEHIGRIPKKLLRMDGYNERLVELAMSGL